MAIRDIIGVISTDRKGKDKKPITAKEWEDAADEIDSAISNSDRPPEGGGVSMDLLGALSGTDGTPSDTNRFVTKSDASNTDSRAPLTHNHTASDITETVVITTDSRLSDARTPNSHTHAPGDTSGTAVITSDSRLSDARTPTTHNHDAAYEPINSNIQTHVTAAHAPSGAQVNADITKAEIEAKLTGALSSHTHAYEAENSNIQAHVTSSHAPAGAQVNADITKAEIEAKLTGALTSHTHAAYAPIDNPTLTGVPAAPTAATGTNTTQLATTAFVRAETLLSKCLTSNFTSSSVTAVSTNLTFAIAANEVFDVDVYGTCSKASSATGLKFAVGAPTGCTVAGFQLGGAATLAASLVPSLITAINTLGTALATGTGIQVAFELHFRVVNSSTAGSITIQCASVTSNTLTIYAGSKMNWARSTQV